ncbi:putative glycoside hydrolase family 15 protein [Akkermansiaceae bacterium]|nr:putative glycoside hydrolase family 15 protein [Akkermansiaceae bacterium]
MIKYFSVATATAATVCLFLTSTSSSAEAVKTQSVELPANFPEFSWEKVPLYMHVRKDTAYTQEEINYLARFPLLTFEKSNGDKDSGSTEVGTLKAARAVKALSPATKILYYRNVIVHYPGYAANDLLSEVDKPFLIGKNGNHKLVRGRVEAYDLSNKALRDWWLDAAREVCADPAIDGIFLDGVVKVIEPGYLKRDIGEEKKAEVLAGYEQMMKDTRAMLGTEKLMLANILRARFDDSGLSYLEGMDGNYIEGFEGAIRMPRKDYVVKGMEAFQKAAKQGKIIAFTCGINLNNQDADESEGAIQKGAGGAESTGGAGESQFEKRFDYMLAMFLICAEKYSYFDLTDTYDAKKSTFWMSHAAQYDNALGAPLGDSIRDGYTFSREFKHASVKLDVENEIGSITWK